MDYGKKETRCSDTELRERTFFGGQLGKNF